MDVILADMRLDQQRDRRADRLMTVRAEQKTR